MSRPLRVEYPGAIYHLMCRGNGRQRVFRDDVDYQRLIDGLAVTVSRYGWEVFSFVLMPNHFHLFVRTPQPNLSRGMQYLASGYANWFAKRHRCPGRLLQGRFKSQSGFPPLIWSKFNPPWPRTTESILGSGDIIYNYGVPGVMDSVPATPPRSLQVTQMIRLRPVGPSRLEARAPQLP
jgi:REP element-mobilizing transposase RayT